MKGKSSDSLMAASCGIRATLDAVPTSSLRSEQISGTFLHAFTKHLISVMGRDHGPSEAESSVSAGDLAVRKDSEATSFKPFTQIPSKKHIVTTFQ